MHLFATFCVCIAVLVMCIHFRVAPKDSLFQITSANHPECRPSPIIPACDCGTSGSYNVPCYIPDQSNLLPTKYSCNPTKARRKREETNPTYNGNYIDVDALNNTLLTGRLPDRTLTWPTPNKHITEQQATEACNDALRSAKSYELCISKINTSFIIEACKTDLQVNYYAFVTQATLIGLKHL